MSRGSEAPLLPVRETPHAPLGGEEPPRVDLGANRSLSLPSLGRFHTPACEAQWTSGELLRELVLFLTVHSRENQGLVG